MRRAGIVTSRQILAHVPELVLSGSKPVREIDRHPALQQRIAEQLRSDDDAKSYYPNHVFVGAADPRSLTNAGRPWWNHPVGATATGSHGAIFSQGEFLAALHASDTTGLLDLSEDVREYDAESPAGRLVASLAVAREPVAAEAVSPIPGAAADLGTIGWGYPGDDSLAPQVVLENLAAKASAALALAECLSAIELDPEALDLVISCSEEAVGDRYQRGGGNLGKAIAQAVGATRASGFDVKDFCAGPIQALVVASSLIQSGVVDTVAVVAGGSLPKLGMKFEGHLKAGMPVLEDCLAGWVAILSADHPGPAVRLDAVGRHPVEAGGSNQRLFTELVLAPLERVGLGLEDVQLFGTELHNPELTEPQGSGNVPERNYRMIAALGARAGHLAVGDVDAFLSERCVAGFSPTQGHIASAVCLLPYALAGMHKDLERVMLVAKASLFLGRMSSLANGVAIVIER